MKKPSPELMIHILSVAALNYSDDLNVSTGLKKSLRTLENFTKLNSAEFEKSEEGSEYQSRCIHNFNKILESVDLDILLTSIGDLEIEK